MQQDSTTYERKEDRPLPKWLTDQRDSLHTARPAVIRLKKDNSLEISVLLTGVTVLLTVAILTVVILRKKKYKK